MNDVNKLYELWLESTADNEDIHSELLAITFAVTMLIDAYKQIAAITKIFILKIFLSVVMVLFYLIY